MKITNGEKKRWGQNQSIKKLNFYAKEMREHPTLNEARFMRWLDSHKINYVDQKIFLEPFQRIVDFYLPEFRLIIEIDGDTHKLTVEKDNTKDNMWRTFHQVETLRIKNSEVLNCEFIEAFCLATGLPLYRFSKKPLVKRAGILFESKI